ncbi:MAG: coenzyme F420-0:L-glutamate ligase / coenzyme F420-1:gamma-L-glutamate ligase [Parcubacteria bacterium C7867-004]|nr:MAG: coenzyme F420-0:L-glutamate ligase / coenzyme F420-1:gamma-L-glutamate ligase [Parcubacteria bacterium C7867-004]
MQVRPVKTRLFREGENLAAFIGAHIPKLKEGSVLIVTSKIVALAEKRTAVAANEKERETLIRAESTFALPTKWVWLTLKDGMAMANAGIDDSNADGKLILLPKDSYKAAKSLRTKLMREYGIANLGIVITDSRVLPLRAGIVGIALGYAGIKGLKDYRKEKDLFGRPFKFEQVSIADGLAASAVLTMGEGDESQPLAVIEGAPVEFSDRIRAGELQIAPEDDIYLPFFGKLKLPKQAKKST